MKPAKFEYHAPSTLDEAIALLVRYGGDAKLLAGGQSLVPLLNFRLARPAALVDLNRITSLAYIREQDGQVRLGAMTRQRTIEFSPVVARRLPLLREATRWVGHLPIRSRGTIGGSIAHVVSPSPLTPLGSKGLGESSSMTVPAVIANAVSDALRPLGISITELPMTPTRLHERIKAARPAGRA